MTEVNGAYKLGRYEKLVVKCACNVKHESFCHARLTVRKLPAVRTNMSDYIDPYTTYNMDQKWLSTDQVSSHKCLRSSSFHVLLFPYQERGHQYLGLAVNTVLPLFTHEIFISKVIETIAESTISQCRVHFLAMPCTTGTSFSPNDPYRFDKRGQCPSSGPIYIFCWTHDAYTNQKRNGRRGEGASFMHCERWNKPLPCNATFTNQSTSQFLSYKTAWQLTF